jgi:hypothetical protein
MPTLRPFRQIDEFDIVNLFSFSGTLPATRGTLVKIQRGFVATDEPIQMLGAVGNSYSNTVSQRYGSYAKIAACGAGDPALGIMLMDVRETDENGELLIFKPRKAAEMDVVLSGQTVPVGTKGLFHYSGALLSTQVPVAHTKLYAGVSGELSTGISGAVVGYALGGRDTSSGVMIMLNCQGISLANSTGLNGQA